MKPLLSAGLLYGLAEWPLFPKEIINSVNSNFIRMFYAKLEKIKPSVLFSFPQECYFFMNIRSLYRSSSFWS